MAQFKTHPGEQKPLLEPELQTIVEAYVLARYGGDIPFSHEVERIKEIWRELDHKWPERADLSS